MTRIRRRILWILAVLLVGVLASAPAYAAAKVVAWGINPMAVGSGTQEALDEFHRQHPDIEVETQTIAGTTGTYELQDMTKLLAAIAAGNPPDVCYIDRYTVCQYAARGALEPLDSYYEQTGLDPNLFMDYAIRESSFEGKIYAIPTSSDTRMLYWNKQLFREAGLNPEVPPTTLEQVSDFAQKLTRVDDQGNLDVIGFVALYGNGRSYNYIYSDHLPLLSEDGRTVLFNTPENIKIFQWVKDTYDMLGGAVKVNAYTSTFQTDANDPFLTGQVAMLVNGDWVMSTYAKYNPDLDYGVALIPNSTGTDLGTWSGGWSFCMPKGAKNPEAGFEFMKWWCTEAPRYSSEAAKAFVESQGNVFIPGMQTYQPLSDYLTETYIAQLDEDLRAKVEFAYDIMQYSTCREISPIAEFSMQQLIAAEDKMLLENLTPEEAFGPANDAVQAELDDFWSKQGAE